MSDQDMAYRLRLWRKHIDAGRVYDAIDDLAQCQQIYGASYGVRSLRHPMLLGRVCQALWGRTKALVAKCQAVAA